MAWHQMSEITIYKSSDGTVNLDVNLTRDTVWLSLAQLVELFGRDKSVISRHLSNIFKNNELEKESVVANFATTASDKKTYQVDFYNLDAIISVGYRVNSTQATQFRIWATQTLKSHLIKGYTLNKQRLAQQGIEELQQSIELLQKTLINQNLINDIGRETIQLIMDYSKTWHLLLAYDDNTLKLPKQGTTPSTHLDYNLALKTISLLKSDLDQRGESTQLFGMERQAYLKGILGNIEQTFDSHALYKTSEERAANLLYFIIKDHPFTDGNKRIGCLLFLLYSTMQHIEININDNGLIALALLIAESTPQQKDLIIKLTVNLLSNHMVG